MATEQIGLHLLQLDLGAGRVHSNDVLQGRRLAVRPAPAHHDERLDRGRHHMHQRALLCCADLVCLHLQPTRWQSQQPPTLLACRESLRSGAKLHIARPESERVQ